MIHLFAALAWDPGFRGALTVVVAVVILMGSAYLLLATNTGARLGFLLALTGLFGWMTIMGVTWSIYGIGKKGEAPAWNVEEINFNDLSSAKLTEARGLPEPDVLPTAKSILAADPELAKQFPATPGIKPPSLGDLLGVKPSLEAQLRPYLPGDWQLLATSDAQTGEAQASASAYLTEQAQVFAEQSDFVLLDAFSLGGKTPRPAYHCAPLSAPSTWGKCLRRAGNRVMSVVKWPLGNPTHYSVVQVQKVVQQETLPGQPPPLAKADPSADVVSVVMVRNLGDKRLPSVGVTVFSALVFAICCNSLHRRDKLVAKARAAATQA